MIFFRLFSEKKKAAGLTLVETLVGIFLIGLIFTGIFGAFELTLRIIGQMKAKTIALAIANEQIEQIRNLPYNAIGTLGGVPAGNIPQTIQLTRNNLIFTVRTTIVYIDDLRDNLAPLDPVPADYKRVKVEVSWSYAFSGKITLITDVAPKGIETTQGGGTLSLSVFDASGLPVAQAQIHLVNNNVNPAIDAWYYSDNQGKFILPGAPVANESYQVSVTKIGYSEDKTIGSNLVANPAKPHLSVYEGQLTEMSFSIDRTSSLKVLTRGTEAQGFPLIYNVPFRVRGAKILGTNSEDQPVFKYDELHNSGSLAEKTIAPLEWDSYNFFVDKTTTGLDLVSVIPNQPFDLLPNTEETVTLILSAEHSLLLTLKDSSNDSPIFGASVRLTQSSLGYEKLQPTDERGRTFFIPLNETTYNVFIEKEGYLSFEDQISVSGFTRREIRLTPQQP
jgi:type II secretory pathway pseudopilin PulG